MADKNYPPNLHKAAHRGEPSYVWRAGQERRLGMIQRYGRKSVKECLLVNGTGIGEYQARLAEHADFTVGLDIEFPRLIRAKSKNECLVCATGENLPFPSNYFTAILSNEVLEHVEDDRKAVEEITRTMRSGGRFILFCPNRGYPFETHGIFWHGEYRFGNKLFINYLPRALRRRLAPHVRVYSRADLGILFQDLPFDVEIKKTIFGAYDNIIKRAPVFGKMIRAVLQFLENTLFSRLGLSHFWVLRKQ